MSALLDRYLELMHAEVDGEASREDLAALESYLANHPEAHKMRDELAELTRILNRVEAIETPPDLHRTIMAALPKRHSSAELGRWSNRWSSRIPLIRYGYALAAGLLLGAALTGIALRNLSPAEDLDVYGTMTSLKNSQRYVLTEQIRLPAPELGGTVELSRSGDTERVVFHMESARPVDVQIDFDRSLGGLQGFSQQPSRVHSFEARQGTISFRSEPKQSSVLILAGAGRSPLPLNLRFYVDGKLAHEARLGAAIP